jgi:glycosyltransferase involved in cell wall biosynthesis
LKILLLTSEFTPVNGGIATYAREIAHAATRLGGEVTVYAPDYGAPTYAEDRRLPFEVRRYSGGLHSRRDMPAKISLVRRIIADKDYDVVHAADWPFFIPMALSRGRTGARLVVTVHGTEINETQRPQKRLAIKLAGVFGNRTEIAANSAYTHALFRDRFNVPAERVRTVHLGVSEFWFGPRAPRAAIRAGLGLAPETITMVTVARLTRRKGHLTTVAGMAALPKSVRERLCWLVIGPDGESEYVEELKAAIAASGCDIRLLGALPSQQIRDIYGACDFFCLTGNWDSSGRVEGFGLVYLEAAAAGLPSVATAVGGVADAVLPNETGLLVEPSPLPVGAAIAELVNDVFKRVSLGKRAWTRARNMSWERCAAGTYYLPLAREHYVPHELDLTKEGSAADEALKSNPWMQRL